MDLAEFQRQAGDGRGRARRRRAGDARAARGGWGASVTEAMGIGDISVSLWGECEAEGRHAFQRPRLRAFRADRSRDRRAPCRSSTAPTGELVLTHLVNRSTPLLRFRTRDHVRVGVGRLRLRAHGAARALHRPHRRHADRARRQRVSLRGARGRQRIRARRHRRHDDPAARGRRAAGAAAAGRRRDRAGRRRRGPRRAHPRAPARQAGGHGRDRRSRRPGSLPRSEYKSKLVEKT